MSYHGPPRGPWPPQQCGYYNQQNNGQWQGSADWTYDPSYIPKSEYPYFGQYDEPQYQMLGQNWSYSNQKSRWAGNYPEQDQQFYGQQYRGNSYRGGTGGNHNRNLHPYQRPIEWTDKDKGNQNRQLESSGKKNPSKQISDAGVSQTKFQNLLEHTKSDRPYKESKNNRENIWCQKGSCDNSNESRKQPNMLMEARDSTVGASSTVVSAIDVLHQPGTSALKNDKENRSGDTVSETHLEVAKIVLQKIHGNKNWTIQKPSQANLESSIPSNLSNSDVTTLGNNVVIRASFLDAQDKLVQNSSSDGAPPVTSPSNTSNLEPTTYCQGDHNSSTASCCTRFSLSKGQQKEITSPQESGVPLVSNTEDVITSNVDVENEMIVHYISSDSDSNDSSAEEDYYGRYSRKKTSRPHKRKNQEGDPRSNLKKSKIMVEDKNKTGQLVEKRNSIEIVDIVHPIERTYDVIEISDDENEQMQTNSSALQTLLPTGICVQKKTNSNPEKQIKSKNSVEAMSTQETHNTTVKKLLKNTSIEHSVPSSSEASNVNPQKVMKRKNSDQVNTQQITRDCQSVDESSTNRNKNQKLSHTKTASSVNSKSLSVATTSQETTRQMTSKQALEPAINLLEKRKQSTSSAIQKSASNKAATALPTSILPNQQGSSVVNLNDQVKESVYFARKSASTKIRKALPISSLPSQQKNTAVNLQAEVKESIYSAKKNESMLAKKALLTSILASRQEGTLENFQEKKQQSTSSTRNIESTVVKKALPTSSLPTQQEGKLLLKSINNSRKPVVLLKRLSPAEILKFSELKKIVDKSSQMYQKDRLNQMKYFISYVYYSRLRLNYNVTLTSEVNDAKDLCNKMVHIYQGNYSCLMEVKCLQHSDHDRITYKALSSQEFDIKKMYNNFLDFRRSSEKLDQYLILTNLDLNLEAFKKNGVKVVPCADGSYKFIVNEKHELHKKFLDCLDLPKLAKLIVESIDQGKQKNFNTGLIKKYHLALIKENIFIVQKKKVSNGKSGLVAKFHPNFIRQTGMSSAAKELYSLLSKKPEEKMEFALSTAGGFGKDINLESEPKIDVKEVADALVYQEEKKLFMLKRDLEKIMGYVLQKEKSDTFGFTKQFFLQGEDLPGDLKRLRREIVVMLQHQGKSLFDFYKSKITIKDFCSDRPVEQLPDENCKELFDEFFKCFAILKIQPTQMYDRDIANIEDKDCIEVLQEELLERIKKQELDLNSLQSLKNLASKCKVKSTLCQHLQTQVDVEFDKKILDTLEAQIPRNNIALMTTNNLPLLNLKIKQLCTKVLKFQEGKESLFITNKTLIEMTSDVLNALAHRTTKLLVVQWSKRMNDSQVLDVISQILNRLRESLRIDSPVKSVIVIGDQENCSFLSNIIPNKIIDNKHSFDLSKDSMANLLHSENVYLQRRKLSLKPDLIPDEHVSTLLESPEILRQLLTGKLIIGKDLTRPPCHRESFFKPQIKQHIVINPQIFHESIEDVFIIRNIDRKDLQQYLPAHQKVLSPNDVPASMRIKTRFILLGFNISTSFFDDYAEKNQKQYSVHLLCYESGSFVWEKTRGNNKHLLRHRLDTINDLNRSQKIKDVVRDGPMTVIICGESGSGKSVCLYTLAKETKHWYRDGPADAYWCLQVNLDKTRLSKFVCETALDFHIAGQQGYVTKFLSSYLELDEVQSKLLTMILHNELKIKLVLFFDNYEELPASDRNFVIELLQELQVSYCEKIYITSTPFTRSQLENKLGVFAYTLEFSEVEKMDFLQGFWSKNVGDVDLTNEAGNLIDMHSKTPSEDDITTTPLQLKMLATMCQPDEDEDFPTVESHADLYKLFVEHKGVKDEESAGIYSLNKLLDGDQLKALNLQHARKGFIFPDDLRHSSFFEYFSAKYLAAKNYSHAVAKCINDLLDTVSPLFIKTYLSELSASDDMEKVVSQFATNGHSNAVKKMIVHCKTKLPLTPVIESEKLEAQEIIRFLLDHYNDTGNEIMLHGELKNLKDNESEIVRYVNRKENPKKETPLKVAARMKNVPIACELLLKGAKITSIAEEFVSEVAKYVADEMCKSESEWLHPIAEKLFKLQPTAVSHLDKKEQLPRLLSYFFTHGRVELINLLLKNDRERYNVLEVKIDDKSPLDLVNESRVLSDDERLEIAKYIVSNVGEDLERKNKYYLGQVLETAAECKHERTFEYFVGKYPDRHMGFLQSAMRSNRLDLIRFLMRKTNRMMYPEENTALHKAVELGVSPTTINFLVNKGGIDNTNKAGETPLCIAFKEGHDLELIEYLIKKDAHLFAKDELGLYPWCYAILNESKYSAEEQMNIMKHLQERETLRAPETEQKISFESDLKRKEVAKKLKYFQKTESFHLPNLELHMALKSNDECWIRFLISQGASVNHKEADGRTPLHVAVEFKRYKLAKMLLDHGATFDVKDKKNITPLKLLLKTGDCSKEGQEMRELLELATELFNGNEKYSEKVPRHLLNCRDVNGQTLLHIAAKSGNKMMIREMIKHSKDYCIAHKDFPAINVNATDSKGNAPLNVVKNNVEVAKELLVNGAIFEPANTPLLHSAEKLIQAVKDKDVEKVKELIKTVCLVNARDESGKSCLHWAASYGSREIVELLLTVRVLDVDAMDVNLKTPLHLAAQNDNIASVFLLLKAGASYDMKDKQGRRPFDLDKENESLKMLRKIHQMFTDIKSDEPRILVNENPDALIDYLTIIWESWRVPRDIVVNVVDCKKNTLLHIATRYDFTSVMENLLRQGATYNPKNKAKKTPESMAISNKWLFKSIAKAQQKLCVSSWMNVDPDIIVNVRFDRGYTLLHDCVTRGKKEEVRWLIENGVDVRATNNRGIGVRCDRKKYPEIFQMLEEEMSI